MPMAFFRSVLVTGATGRQGGAVARQLLSRGHRVTAFVRDAGAPAAVELRSLGAELTVGNFDDVDSIVRAAQGMDAMYAMATPFEAGVNTEIRQGLNLADAARLQATGSARTPVQDENNAELVETIWKMAVAGTPPKQCEAEVPVDAYRVRRLLAHWVEEGALTVAG